METQSKWSERSKTGFNLFFQRAVFELQSSKVGGNHQKSRKITKFGTLRAFFVTKKLIILSKSVIFGSAV